jgi:hypothetical protein
MKHLIKAMIFLGLSNAQAANVSVHAQQALGSIPNAIVVLTLPSGQKIEKKTDLAGIAAFGNHPPGIYSVYIAHQKGANTEVFQLQPEVVDFTFEASFEEVQLENLPTNLLSDLSNSLADNIARVVLPEAPVALDVVWRNVVGVNVAGNSLTQSGTVGWGYSGASSSMAISSGSGYVEFTNNEANTYKMAGLSHADPDQGYTALEFAIYPDCGGNVYIFERGINRGAVGTYKAGDVFRVAVNSGVVTYYKNGTLLYTSTQTAEYPLVLDTTLYSTNATIANAKIVGANLSTSTLVTTPLSPPVPTISVCLVTDSSQVPRSLVTLSGAVYFAKETPEPNACISTQLPLGYYFGTVTFYGQLFSAWLNHDKNGRVYYLYVETGAWVAQ